MTERAVAQALLEINAIGYSADEPITFKSGIKSPVYVDNRKLPYYPNQWRVVIDAFQRVLQQEDELCEIVAGVAVGGVPHSATLGYLLRRPSIFIRKEAKEHGEKKRVEGGDVNGRHVVLVEDLVTTGGSSLNAIQALRDEGAITDLLVAIVSYGFEEAITAFEQANVRLHTLTSFPVILDVAREQNYFTDEQITVISDWYQAPHHWGK